MLCVRTMVVDAETRDLRAPTPILRGESNNFYEDESLVLGILSETIMTKPFDTVFNVLTRRSSSLLLHGVSRYCSL